MITKELTAASTKPLVLAVLSKGESYGYAIIQHVREQSGGNLEWSEGMLYPVLHRMEEEKLILASWKVGDNGRKRKYYRLSASGTRAIDRERQQWLAVHDTLTSLWGPKPCST
ncbi:PadR family transcriptional regulator [Adhaeretor mobilis]|uniref:Lineage-specific thermal regulator protein n=1 Tax=Adhaeretor mobilis TaxID=1930276 RepID=A0A517MQU6_9BACT|nr:helix-turn-helix transcriptional regulator [Adhaeretor mobilis]QDS97258.1 lineage-specific thermal regulator protein [Adhaeretor mobilis]